MLPSAWLRLAGGREYVLGELQAMGLLAGANALIVGNYLTSTGRPPEEDHALLEALGMPVADGPGEGRFVVDSARRARPARPSPCASASPSAPSSTPLRTSRAARPRSVNFGDATVVRRPVRKNSARGPGR